eukprot:CAMPEP_0204363026 /NCGR_PEP_ID=MMETSP0469-20131031/40056_1 /ASSEMBLY_ACC=CAM_ASM_000384 /TAXON_ID=2969 /ORGANISM="Oxyrrhis marina" /LENGTH=60 /DNA_ID=CAMNT_0051351715 /DNA_START=91 /DNA_END=270 /DNA_ORIENTATION=+
MRVPPLPPPPTMVVLTTAPIDSTTAMRPGNPFDEIVPLFTSCLALTTITPPPKPLNGSLP